MDPWAVKERGQEESGEETRTEYQCTIYPCMESHDNTHEFRQAVCADETCCHSYKTENTVVH